MFFANFEIFHLAFTFEYYNVRKNILEKQVFWLTGVKLSCYLNIWLPRIEINVAYNQVIGSKLLRKFTFLLMIK